MNERVFHGGIERLRDPQRLALLEVERVVDLCLDGTDAKSVLDVGTGSGIFVEAFAARGLSITGIDSNLEMVAAAAGHVPAGDFRQASAEALPFPDGSFDLVFLGLILHEADDAVRALREARRLARRRVVVLEWPFREDGKQPPLAHRLKADQVIAFAHEASLGQAETISLANLVLFRFEVRGNFPTEFASKK
jgi:ubiquinone/menaquinone biosynthesis C-methylase UbiE